MPEQRIIELKLGVVDAEQAGRQLGRYRRALEPFMKPTRNETLRAERNRIVYLGGKATPAEREPIEDWLAEDPPTWAFHVERRYTGPVGVAMHAAAAGEHVQISLGNGRVIGIDDFAHPLLG